MSVKLVDNIRYMRFFAEAFNIFQSRIVVLIKVKAAKATNIHEIQCGIQ